MPAAIVSPNNELKKIEGASPFCRLDKSNKFRTN